MLAEFGGKGDGKENRLETHCLLVQPGSGLNFDTSFKFKKKLLFLLHSTLTIKVESC